jgi:molybdopterin converting factor small subunit
MRILFFSQVRDAAGRAEVEWTGCEPMTIEIFWGRLLRQFPALDRHRAAVRIARNGAFIRSDETLEPGDEIALIPPVSGG